MTVRQRLRILLAAALMIIISIILIALPIIGIPVAQFILSAILLVMGARYMIYYFTMAKHMVGGKMMLYFGIILLDVGVFLLTLLGNSQEIILMYLQLAFGITGAIAILRAVEAKKSGSRSWKGNLIHGAICIGIMIFAVICTFAELPERMVVYVFCAGLLYSAAMRIYSAFRRTAVLYAEKY